MVDANPGWPVEILEPSPRWDEVFAAPFAQRIEKYDVAWIEDPLHRGDFASMASTPADEDALRRRNHCGRHVGRAPGDPRDREAQCQRRRHEKSSLHAPPLDARPWVRGQPPAPYARSRLRSPRRSVMTEGSRTPKDPWDLLSARSGSWPAESLSTVVATRSPRRHGRRAADGDGCAVRPADRRDPASRSGDAGPLGRARGLSAYPAPHRPIAATEALRPGSPTIPIIDLHP